VRFGKSYSVSEESRISPNTPPLKLLDRLERVAMESGFIPAISLAFPCPEADAWDKRSSASLAPRALFIREKSSARHPEADGKALRDRPTARAAGPIMILARPLRPENSVRDPVIIAGRARLAYWAGRAWQHTRCAYSGGLPGRKLANRAEQAISAPASSTAPGSLQNFERPESFEYAVDQAVQRLFTGRYRGPSDTSNSSAGGGGHVNLNAEEIQFIVDELFVGNNLAAPVPD